MVNVLGACYRAYRDHDVMTVEMPSAVGIAVAPNPSAMGETMADVLGGTQAA